MKPAPGSDSELSTISDTLNVLEKKDIKNDSDPKKIKGASKKKTSVQNDPVTLPPTCSGMPDLNTLRHETYI